MTKQYIIWNKKIGAFVCPSQTNYIGETKQILSMCPLTLDVKYVNYVFNNHNGMWGFHKE